MNEDQKKLLDIINSFDNRWCEFAYIVESKLKISSQQLATLVEELAILRLSDNSIPLILLWYDVTLKVTLISTYELFIKNDKG